MSTATKAVQAAKFLERDVSGTSAVLYWPASAAISSAASSCRTITPIRTRSMRRCGPGPDAADPARQLHHHQPPLVQ